MNAQHPATAPDPIAAAIASTEAQPKQIAMKQFQVRITSTGRPAMLALPADASDGEIAEFAGWLLGAVLASYRQEREQGPGSGIIVPPAGVHVPRALDTAT